MSRFSLLAVLGLWSCGPSSWQPTPPQLLAAVVSDESRELALEFDKPVKQAAVGGDLESGSVNVSGAHVTAALAKDLKPGKRYGWSAEVKDSGGNQTSVAGGFYGPNDHPASLKLSEVRVAGQGDHTDFVELRVESTGSLGGWTLDAYAAADTRQRLILPDTAAASGELIVVRYRDGESDTKGAREFRLPQGRGLPASKGLLVLRPTPTSQPSDGLLYSKNRGEGVAIAEAAGWQGRDELSPENCTPTRTWNRKGSDWVLTGNGGATPGQPNSASVWAGPTTPKKSSKTKAKSRSKSGRGRRFFRVSRSTRVAGEASSCDGRSKGAPVPAQTGTNRRRRRPPELPGWAGRHSKPSRPSSGGLVGQPSAPGGAERRPIRIDPSARPVLAEA